jgi:formate/nitrite transporter FocA (FNT family)
MSLSAREQRILREIERELAKSKRDGRWLAAMIGGLVIGIAILSAGVALGNPAMMIGGAVLTQLSPAALVARGLIAALFRARQTGATGRSGLMWRR